MDSNNLENVNYESLANTDEKKADNPERKKKILILIIILVISIIVISLVIFFIIKYTGEPKYDDGEADPENALYGCMCDAGSSSTRVSVYRWPHRNKNIIPLITEIGRQSIGPGIHEMNEKVIESSMNYLIDFCKDTIYKLSNKKSNLSEANFYLKATAGMRSISEEEQNKKLDIIRNVIKKSNLKFLNDDWVKVIDGSEEGLFGWITGNYLNKILFENEKEGKLKNIPYGSIDLGGYSLEITFTTNETIKEHNTNLNLSEINYNLYSYSFQDYGQTRFATILLESIIRNSSKSESSNIITNPCYLEGYTETYEFENIKYTIIGKNDFQLCQEYVKSIMNISEENEKSMNNVYQPKIPENMNFYGISGLYWIANFFKIADDKFHSASDFLNPTEEFCKKKWESVIKEYDEDIYYLKNYCTIGYYVYYFLVDGFKIDKDKKILAFPEKINGIEPGWTLGAMSYEIELLPLQGSKNLNY